MKKAVIFDMDGVIVDSEPVHIASELEVLKTHGIDLKPQALKQYCGRDAAYIFSDWIKKYHLDTTIEKLREEKLKLYFSMFNNKAKLFPGTRKLIQKVRAKGLAIGLASSSPKEIISLSLHTFGLEEVFDTIVSGDDVQMSKPEPEIFLATAKKLSKRPEDCVVIEDAVNGIIAAKKADMKVIGICSTFSRKELEQADMIFNRIQDIKVHDLIHD